jgi:hypothetical protein
MRTDYYDADSLEKLQFKLAKVHVYLVFSPHLTL